MKITYGHAITAELKMASDALKACGDYSVANPTVRVKENPFLKETNRTHRKATGSVRVLWECDGCGRIDPRITENLKTECCGKADVNFRDHR